MADELDLVRRFRSDIPGPSADAWARARAAVDAERAGAVGRGEGTRRARRRWPLTISAIGAASGSAAIVSVVVLGGSPPAFAGWSAKPTAPTAVQSVAAQDDCLGTLDSLPGGAGSWSEVITDVRGPYSIAVYQNAQGYATCFTGPSFTFASFTSSDGQMMFSASGSSAPTPGSRMTSSSGTGVTSPGGGLAEMVVSHLSETGNGPYTLVEGRLDPTVSALTLELEDGQDVTATTADGWFVAWWPGSQDVSDALITSPQGTTTEPVKVPTAPAPPAPPGNGTAGLAPGLSPAS